MSERRAPKTSSNPFAEEEQKVLAHALPRHIGIIMDGNGRWAQARARPRVEGHREGSRAVREVARCARRIGVRALTLYAFSAQNWERPESEVSALMELLAEFLVSERAELRDNRIRLNAIGELERLPTMVRVPLKALCEETKENPAMVLTLALSYGSREELLSMVRRLASEVAAGRLEPTAIGEKDVERSLWTRGLPDVDLIIRTSGEQRLSNFLLWQSAYAELVFLETPWPEFGPREFLEAIAIFQKRQRRFGRTGEQASKAT